MVMTFLGCILFLIGDVPMVLSYGIYISQLLCLIGDVPMVLSNGIYISRLYIKVITKLPNSEQSYKGKVQTHNYINRQNQSTTGKL